MSGRSGLSDQSLEKLRHMLLDEGHSNMIFTEFKKTFNTKLQTFNMISSQLEQLVGEVVKANSTNSSTVFLGSVVIEFLKMYMKESILLLDVLQTINRNVIENRNSLMFFAKELVKQKVLSEDTSKLLVNKIIKLEENQDFNDKEVDKLSKEMSQLLEYIPTLKFTKKKQEDESKDTTTS
jgi:hypothetical protein